MDEYAALRDKVDAFTSATADRRTDAFACRRGCTECCHVQLEVSDVEAAAIRAAIEALEPAARAALAERARAPKEACVMLEPDGGCAVYAARPLVCRTQGHALRYADTGVTWCPLNYTERGPEWADVLDAERVDVLLALVNRRATETPLARTSLAALAVAGDPRPVIHADARLALTSEP